MPSRPPSQDPTLTYHSPASPKAEQAARARYLLVYGQESSFRVPLPLVGEVILGRGAEAQVVVEDLAASRRHARITCGVGDLVVEDLGSHNGTVLNGQKLSGPTPLRRGDTLAIGETYLVLLAEAEREAPRALSDAVSLMSLIEAQAARARREAYVCAVFWCEAESPIGTRPTLTHAVVESLARDEHAGVLAGGHLVVLAPVDVDDPRDRARTLLDRLVSLDPSARVGISVCPTDAADAATLLASARAAAEVAAAGTVHASSETYAEKDLGGGQRVLLAEPAMVRAYDLLARLAAASMPILVRGETGSGKELAALAVHAASPRASGAYRAVNCAALAESLLEAELFGHERGAFTGATAMRKGVLEQAQGGTLFLDEVGELSLGAQAKLLRVLETGKLTRVGGDQEIALDVRLVAATHRDLAADANEGRFRKDLLFRLGAAIVVLPPLRERPREVALLARLFVTRACARLAKPALTLAPLTMQKLSAHRWPGNVRELRNVIDYAVALADGATIEPWHLPELHGFGDASAEPVTADQTPAGRGSTPPSGGPSGSLAGRVSLADEIRTLERTRILEALTESVGVQTRAAELLGMPVRTLFAKLRAHAIDPKSFVKPAAASTEK